MVTIDEIAEFVLGISIRDLGNSKEKLQALEVLVDYLNGTVEMINFIVSLLAALQSL